MMKKKPKNRPQSQKAFVYLFIIAGVLTVASVLQGGLGNNISFSSDKAEELSISQFLKQYEQNVFTEVEVGEIRIEGTDANGQMYWTTKERGATIQDLGLNDLKANTNVKIEDTSTKKMIYGLISNIAPIILFLVVLFFIFRFMSKKGGGPMDGTFGMGKSKARVYQKGTHSITFEDVAGVEEAKDEVVEIVDFLKNPKKYEKMGAKIPRGVLMTGEPGTGKTLLARAMAGEANVPFFSVSGSEFEEMLVGVGASRVRDLFKMAKRNSPSIIFIDEIDAVGKKRSTSGQHSSAEQTLNQILTEMDGFEKGVPVIVVAATNRPETLDKALMRPGRFDRQVYVDLPDMEARKKILRVHAKNKKFTEDANLDSIASKTVNFSGADLENLLNEAAILAVKNGKNKITHEMLEESVEKVSMGPARKSRRINDKERNIVAHHEVGHAIAGHFAGQNDPVHKITIISRGSALGVAWFLPKEDTYLKSEQELKDEMVRAHGGRVAERLIFGEVTTGASSDLMRITQIARNMITRFGMGDPEKLGPVVFTETAKRNAQEGVVDRGYSEDTAREIDKEVQRLVMEADARCEEILKKHLPALKKIAQDLLERETIYRDEFLGYFEQ